MLFGDRKTLEIAVYPDYSVVEKASNGDQNLVDPPVRLEDHQ